MARERKQEGTSGGALKWMSAYGVLVTLLLCFFVLLYAKSSLGVPKFKTLAATPSGISSSLLSDAVGADGISDMLGNGILEMPIVKETSEKEKEKYKQVQDEIKSMSSDFKTYFAENNQVKVNQLEDGILITFSDALLFDSGKAVLRSQAIEILDLVAVELIKYADNDIDIEGHADNIPIHNAQFQSNWYLSSARAITVGSYFIDQKKLNPSRVSASGRGEYMPLVPNTTPENRAINRRVEIKIKSTYFSNNIS